MFTIQNGFGIPLPHLFRMQTHQAVFGGNFNITFTH